MELTTSSTADLRPNVTIDTADAKNCDKDEVTLETIIVLIGQFGKFQIIVFMLISLPIMFNSIFSITFAFTASSVVHRCNITECDTAESGYDEPWTAFAIPTKGPNLDQCHRYASAMEENITTTISQGEFNNESIEVDTCTFSGFNRKQIDTCSSGNYILRDKEVTISNEFNIFCADEWKLSMVGTLNNIGQFVGIPIGGYISDRYGRRTAIALCGFAAAIFGTIRSFATSYIFFVTFEVLDSMAASSLYSTCFIVGIELVGPKKRVKACNLVTLLYAIGQILLALVAKYYQNWRILLRIMYVPALIMVVYIWILPESVRWLLCQRKEDEARNILKRAAKINKRKLSDQTLDKLFLANRDKLEKTAEGKFPIKQAFTTFFWRIANCSFCWMVNVLVYFGISLNALHMDGNKYNNFLYTAMVEVPGLLLPLIIMDRFGRRYSLFGCMFTSGLCCLATIFFPPDAFYVRLSLFLISKSTITASFQVLYFSTSEIFPTTLRNSLLSFCSMMGRLGAMVAPQTPLLAKYYQNAPALLFATTALASACLSLLFPETANKVLPTTMKEADNIGSSEEKESTRNGQNAHL